MADNTKISIILVNWNGIKWLDKCLNSIANQTYTNLEVVFVDNGSSDDSVEYTRNNFRNVKIIESGSNLGFAGGVNLGVKSCSGDVVMLLNTDAWIEADLVEKLYESLVNQQLDVAAPIEVTYDKKKRKVFDTTIDLLGHPIYLPVGTTSSFYLSGVCIMFFKELFESTLGLDSDFFMYMEEIDWFWRLNLLGKRYDYIESLSVYHAGAGSTGNGVKYNSFLWRNQNTLQMLIKNYEIENLLWVLPLYAFQNFIEMFFFLMILKPKISLSYIRGWTFNIRHAKTTYIKRRQIQDLRENQDQIVMSKMYRGSAKARHLITFYQHG